MTSHQTASDANQKEPAASRGRRKYPWAMLIVALLFVVIPFLSWYGTWFGRPLSDEQLARYLKDENKPRNVQHALAQISDRITKGDETVKRWYPDVIVAAGHNEPQVRLTAAWVMGQDNRISEFHTALLAALSDPHPGVRLNAALALVRFGDSSGRQQMIASLQPRVLTAELDGFVEVFVEEEGMAVAPGTPLVRIRSENQEPIVLHAVEDARIESVMVWDNKAVRSGDKLMSLSPGIAQVENILAALALVGQPEDIPSVQRYSRPLPGMPNHIRERAAWTSEAIRKRASATP